MHISQKKTNLVSFHESEQATFTEFFPFETSFSASRALNSIFNPDLWLNINLLFGNTISGKCGSSNSFMYLQRECQTEEQD